MSAIVGILFYIFAIFSILGTLTVITSVNPVRAVISKVFIFFSFAGVWLTLQQEFLALLLIMIYVGAVLVMFLFVVMMLDIELITEQSRTVRHWFFVCLICSFLLLVTLLAIVDAFPANSRLSYPMDLKQFAFELFSVKYLYIFQVSGLILLSAIIVTITLSLSVKQLKNKLTVPEHQIKVNPKNRVNMLDLGSIQDDLHKE